MLRFIFLLSVQSYNAGYVIHENAAVGRNTFQSSISSGGLARYAVDGNDDNIYHHGSCSHTAADVHPWWVVDLNQTLDIIQVDIINRGDCCNERLHDVNVGISNISPLNIAPVPGNYSLCGHVAGILTNWNGIRCDLNPSGRHLGRYVIIQIVSVNIDVLTLCEVKEYAAPQNLPVANNPTRAVIDRKMSQNFLIGKPFFTSKIACVAYCHNEPGCGSVNFKQIEGKRSGQCELNRVKFYLFVDDGDDGTFTVIGWHWYNLI